MNKTRRKTIERIATEIAALVSKLEDCKTELEAVRDEEQEYYDAMPESFQNGDKGAAATDAIEKLDAAIEAITFDDEIDLSID